MVIQILLVEDSESQVGLVREALKTWSTPFNLHVTNSAEDALEFLNRSSGYGNVPHPNLVLVDLNLPKQPGFVVLEAIRKNPALGGTVAVVLSSSTALSDIQRAALLAAAYIEKPIDLHGTLRLFQALEQFWRVDARFALKRTGFSQ